MLKGKYEEEKKEESVQAFDRQAIYHAPSNQKYAIKANNHKDSMPPNIVMLVGTPKTP